MRILLVGNYFYPEHIGGVEVVSYNLVKQYRQFGHQVRWVAADVPPTLRSVIDGDIPIRAWNITEEKMGFPNPIPYPGAVKSLYKSVRWCDVIHLQDCLYFINILTYMLAKLYKKPILITQHTKKNPYKSRAKYWLQSVSFHTIAKYMHLKADKSVFVSQKKHDYLSFITDHIQADVIKNGVDTDLFKPLPSDIREEKRLNIRNGEQKPIILFAGRLVEIKGFHLLIPIIEKHPEWHWLIVGRPDDYDPTDWDYPNFTYQKQLDMQGMQNAYALSDVLLHPSEGEISLIILESMACGTPAILSEALLSETSENEKFFFLPVARDSQQIEKKLIALLSDPTYLLDLRERVRKYSIQTTSWKEVSKKYLSLLEQITK